MDQTIKSRVFAWLGFLLISIPTLHIAFNVEQSDFYPLISFYALGFVGLFLSFKYADANDLFILLIGGIVIRLLMLNVTPGLSDDFYRFIWDGEMMNLGVLPYAKTPNEIISSTPEIFQNAELRAIYHGMGELSQSNYSNYPPLNELLFFISSKLGGTLSSKIMILRTMIILADIGIILIGISLLKLKNLNPKNILLFALNPFVLLEFTANLHFEGVMMFFFLAAVYFYVKELKLVSSLFFSFSILTKVLTLIFLPLFIKKKDLKGSLMYIVLVALFTFSFAYPFFMKIGLSSYNSSNLLYFQNFEFNASVYFVFREIGELFLGYNPIAIVGPALAIISALLILALYYKRSSTPILNAFEIWTIAFLIFLGLSTTVHPWYIGILLIVGIFTNYKFPVIWSFLAFLSYYFYVEGMNLVLYYCFIALEYLFVFGYAFYEWKRIKMGENHSGLPN